ncbi:DUF1320 domain-containing protein [Herbaspirillum sp. ST 5-3]|uniref:gp436 family protein n=1 Tax=Oxalobacteraceae TaxID=75682 RepID=UPI0010A4F8AB|nr:DUF1320 domain-containing protein [Herbaspirillum sp. ST 5-3]
MPYATRTDLEQRYGEDEVAQREAALPAGAVDRALADADALIDGYLSGRYVLPLSPVPGILPQLACAIARYNLLGDSATERSRNDFTDAIAWLRAVQDGRVLLVSSFKAESAPAATVTMTAAERVFTRAGRP